ncbi:MAG: hypothetical protein LBD17_03150, partial [Endomicrobium sp.]|nr:hypothetical protein [Endomicrobium sp.]
AAEKSPSLMMEKYRLATIEYNKFLQKPRGKDNINWDEPHYKPRGLGYEDAVYAERFSHLQKTPVNAEVYDAFGFETGHGVSIKSMRLTDKTYAEKPSQITAKLNGYIKDVIEFDKIDRTNPNVFKVSSKEVKAREIFLGVPKEITLEQFMAIQKSVDRAKANDIILNFRIEE